MGTYSSLVLAIFIVGKHIPCLFPTDSVEKVGHGVRSRKVRVRDGNDYFWQRPPDSDFTWRRAKKAFSPVNDQAVWADRLFSTESANSGRST